MVKKHLIFLLCAVLNITALFPCFSDSAIAFDSKSTVVKDGTFSYLSSYLRGEGRDASAHYTYKDSFFKESGTRYNGDLALMSLCMAMSAFASKVNEDPTSNIKELFDGIGLEYKNNATGEESVYYPSPEKNSIGLAIGRKTILVNNEKCTLIALAVRGAGYGKEWAGNAELGTGENHSGFEKAAKTVCDTLSEFISGNKIIGRIKIWMTGYSRAAAVCNIAGAYLNKGFVNGISQKDIYVYCFECPNTTLNESQNDNGNIFCIVNDQDIVTKVPFDSWGYTRYGKTYYLPSIKNTNAFFEKKNAMMRVYKDLLSGSGIVSEPKYYESIGTYAFQLDDLLSGIGKTFGRDEYVRSLQGDIGDILSKAIKMISGGEISGSGALSLISDIMKSSIGGMTLSLGDAGLIIKLGESYFTVPLAYADRKIVEILASGQEEMGLVSMAMALMTSMQSYSSLMNIFSYHYPELCLSWMMTSGNELEKLNQDDVSAKYTFLTVIGQDGSNAGGFNVDVTGNDKNTAVLSDSSSEKTVIVPSGADHTIEIKAAENGKITLLQRDIRYKNGETVIERALYYKDIPVSKGDRLTGYTGKTKYNDVLIFNGIEKILPYHIKSEKETGGITVRTGTEKGGRSYGTGTFLYGTLTKVAAAAEDGYSFAGWYDGKEFVSDKTVYEFPLTDDIILTAFFKNNNAGATQPSVPQGSEITSGTSESAVGSTFVTENAGGSSHITKTTEGSTHTTEANAGSTHAAEETEGSAHITEKTEKSSLDTEETGITASIPDPASESSLASETALEDVKNDEQSGNSVKYIIGAVCIFLLVAVPALFIIIRRKKGKR